MTNKNNGTTEIIPVETPAGGVTPTAESKYYLSEPNSGICERLPLSKRFAQKLSRGAMGNPNMFLTSEQQSTVKQYIPAAGWSKDERVVYILLQNLVDKTGVMPTAAQIAEVSKGRAEITARSGVRTATMGSMQVVDMEPQIVASGLSENKVQRALNRLQRRGAIQKLA